MSDLDDDELLAELRDVRSADVLSMKALVSELIDRRVYPTTKLSAREVFSKVEFYGAYWHLYGGWLNCPYCKVDLRDLTNGTPFKREIGHILNDRLHNYNCPDCKRVFPLSPTGSVKGEFISHPHL